MVWRSSERLTRRLLAFTIGIPTARKGVLPCATAHGGSVPFPPTNQPYAILQNTP
jgi:hypothetical protein